jgi:hypothetical protein
MNFSTSHSVSIRFWLAVIACGGIFLSPRTEQTVLWSNKRLGTMRRHAASEFLNEHQKVQRLEAALTAVNERLKAQDTKIDKVNAKVELTKPAPQTVAKNQ